VRRVLAALGFLLLACERQAPAPPPPSRPAASVGTRLNVLLITIDTLRADHLGLYGYRRPTSPRLDAFAKRAVVFDQAYTYWPKTRGSFVALMSGRRDSQTGYGKTHPLLLDFNPSLAQVLKQAGYRSAATVDNANVAAQHGFARGFERYRETWQESGLPTEMDRARAITGDGVAFVENASPSQPFFLWLHYVNPHAPYTPPAPYDTAFVDAGARSGPRLRVVDGFVGGIRKEWAVAGQDRLGYYVAQYDGEIAAVDQEVGRVLDALEGSPVAKSTVVVVTSDHGESLGEHDYFFDHGQDLFDPSLRIPLLVAVPGVVGGGRTSALASTLDLVPTVLDAVKVSYPPDLAGTSLLPAVRGQALPERERLFARNDRNLSASFDARRKVVATPTDSDLRYALFDRAADPGERKELTGDDLRVWRRELELFLERAEREWTHTRGLLGDRPSGEAPMTKEACAQMKALGYVLAACR
ncbi:MAG TPA: sulfatase, partial [Vicinamibacteria bacterium]|nr:sulfatase [Vicinamibacteria bacterium]